jgi:hypothetical protein
MSYREIIEECKKEGFTPKTSYIAHIKNIHGKTSRTSPLRTGDYKYPCPDSVKPKLEKIMKKLDVI